MANISVDEEEFYAEGGSELATISQSPFFPKKKIVAFMVFTMIAVITGFIYAIITGYVYTS